MNKSESKYFHTAVKMDLALIALLKEKPIEYITVRELCETAGVNRSTFYLHYENTRDLLEETLRFLIDRFLSYFPVDTGPITDGFQSAPLEDLNYISEEYVLPYLTYVRDNRKVFAIALDHAGCFDFDTIYQRMFQHIFHPILSRFRFPDDEQPYVMAFYLNGVHAVIRQWVKNGCSESRETICGILSRCILGKCCGSDLVSMME